MKLNINDEQGIELLHFIFEREFKPPFRKGKKDDFDRYPYYNRDNEYVGRLDSYKDFSIQYDPFRFNIKYKVCQVFELPYDTFAWRDAIEPHLKSWLENQINIKLSHIYL